VKLRSAWTELLTLWEPFLHSSTYKLIGDPNQTSFGPAGVFGIQKQNKIVRLTELSESSWVSPERITVSRLSVIIFVTI